LKLFNFVEKLIQCIVKSVKLKCRKSRLVVDH
jgi:hypothetical protein